MSPLTAPNIMMGLVGIKGRDLLHLHMHPIVLSMSHTVCLYIHVAGLTV